MTISSTNTHSNVQTRVLAILAALALAFSIGTLAGCGNNDAASSSASADSASASTAAEQINVTVSVDFTAADGKVETAEVSVPAGSNVPPAGAIIAIYAPETDSSGKSPGTGMPSASCTSLT